MSLKLSLVPKSDVKKRIYVFYVTLYYAALCQVFQQPCGESLTISQFESEEGVDDPIALFTAKLNKIAEKNIP